MNTAGKLATFAVLLALVAGGGYAVGNAVGPVGSASGPAHVMPQADASTAGTALPGLASSLGGYTFAPASSTFTPGAAAPFTYRILGPDGMPVTRYDIKHDKLMHLIVVRRDGSNYQHLHPELGTDGTWSVPLNLAAAGSYRAFADFAPAGGQPTTLGVDVAAPGDFQPVEFPESRVAEIDGFRVELVGELAPGRSSLVTATVTRNGAPVTDLQPYLGAFGHLVALRKGDLAYLHVHPDGVPGDGRTPSGPEVKFYVEVPSAGAYRLALDFQQDGVVRTAGFSVATIPSDGISVVPVPALPDTAPRPPTPHDDHSKGQW